VLNLNEEKGELLNVSQVKKNVTDGKRCDQTPFSDQYAANPKGERKTSRKICPSLLVGNGVSMLWYIYLGSLTCS
jgi:hypothetical protein